MLTRRRPTGPCVVTIHCVGSSSNLESTGVDISHDVLAVRLDYWNDQSGSHLHEVPDLADPMTLPTALRSAARWFQL
jgi:hypothetical protein